MLNDCVYGSIALQLVSNIFVEHNVLRKWSTQATSFRPNPFHANYFLNIYNLSSMHLNKILFKPRCMDICTLLCTHFLPFLQKEATSVTSSLLPWVTKSFQKEVYSLKGFFDTRSMSSGI